MKLRLPHKFQAALMAALASVSFTTLSSGSAFAEESSAAASDGEMGLTLFMGDSITHGVLDASYRWQLFKTFVDNGVYFSIDGPISGYNSTPADGDNTGGSATYRGVGFVNEHYAKASGRAYEMISGTSRYNNISVATLGQMYDISTGALLIGTNDILSDTGNVSGVSYATYADKFDNLLGGTVSYSGTDKSLDAQWTWTKGGEMNGNLNTILNSMNLGAGDQFYVFSVPVWAGGHNNHTADSDYAAVAGYNSLLEQWVNVYNSTSSATVKYVNVNQGLVDVTSSTPFIGNKSFFNNGSDALHPSEQGSLIMAGNVAQAMGIGGRTAGLVRSAATEEGWSQAPAAITFNPGDAAQTIDGAQFTVADGYTVDFTAVFGDGSANNWLDADKDRQPNASKVTTFSTLTNSLNIQVGDGTHTGTLKLAEGYVAWSAGNGDMVLYCQDNSVSGNEALRIAYREADSANNILGGYYVWKGDMLIGQGLASVDGSLNGITLSITGSQNVGGTISNLSWANTAYAPTTELFSSTPLPSHDNETAASLGINFEGAAAANERYGTNNQQSSGNLLLQRTGGTETNGWFGPVGTAHTGDVLIKYSGLQISNNANIIAVINGSVTNGNVAIVLDDGTHVGKGHYGSTGDQSIHGVYGQSVGGALKVEVNNATLDGGILMGVINGSGSISGGTQLVVNQGAAVGGSVYGGGLTGTVNGGTSITITGGSIAGSVYGAGMGGTVNGNSAINITGGVISGDVIGGAQGGTFNGTSSVTITGNLPYIGGNITADTVTLTDVNSDPDHSDTFDKYRGTITADTIVLDNYKVEKILANLVTQSLVLQGGTNVTIHHLNLTACEIEAESGSSATLDGTLTLGNTATYTGNVTLADGLTIDMAGTGETSGGAFSDGENGFIVGGEVTVMQRGTSGTLTLDTAKLTGAGVLAGSTFTYDATSGALTAAVQGETDTYYVNTGTVVYGGPKSAKNITSAVTVELRPTVSATLELAETLSADCTGGIVVAQNAVGANIKIDDGITLQKTQVNAQGGVALQGNGIYALESGRAELGTNVSLGDDWKGIVLLSNYGSHAIGNSFSLQANSPLAMGSNSFIGLSNINGWFNNSTTIGANLYLVDGVNSEPALNIVDNSNREYTFNGAIAGDGTWKLKFSKDGERYNLNGDISGWTGNLVFDAASKGLSLRIADDEVNAGISGPASITAKAASTTFNGDLTNIKGLTFDNGKHVTLNGTTTFASGAASTIGGTIYNNGAMTLAGTATINLSGNESSFELFTGSGSTNTYDGAGGFGGNGHLTSETAQYCIIKGGADSSLTGTFEGTTLSADGKSLVMSGAPSTGLYYVNTQVTYGSAVAENTTGYVVADGATFTVGSNVGTVLSTTTGTGTFVVSEGATLDAAPYSTAYAGTLKVAGGKTLQIGNNTGHNMNLGTIGAVELGSGSTLSFKAQYATLNDVSVDSGTATIKFLDTKTEGTEALRLTGTTRIDSGKTLSLQSEWKATMTIEKLAGEGTLKIQGNGHNEGRAYTINGSDGKFGTITLSGFKSDNATRRAQLIFGGDTQLTMLQTADGDTPKGTDVIVKSGATVSMDNFNNGWGLENLQVDGILNVSGELKYATGAGSQNIKGTGVINTAALKVGNAGGYVLDGANGLVVNIGSGGISNAGSSWNYTTTLKDGVTLGATADWTGSEAMVLSGSAIINTQDPSSGTGHNVNISGVLSGSGSLTKDGEGTLTLSGANTFTGGIDVSAGTLKLGNQAGFGNTSQTITVGKDGTVDLNGQIDANYTYTLAGGTLTNSGNAIPDTNSQTKGLVLTADSTVNAESGHDFRLLAPSYDPTSLKLGGNTLAKTGGGQFELRNTTVEAGTIDVQSGSVYFHDGTTAANINFSGGNVTGSMNLSGNISMTAEAATTTSVAIAAGNHAVTFDGAQNMTESGAISGTGASVVKNGAGTLTLSGNNSYTGGTTVNAGTLIAASANALGSGPVVVNADGTLELTSAVSSISGNMNVGQGGTLKLAGMGDTALSATGTFTLGNNSILDLTGLTSIAGTEQSITLVKGGIIDDTYLSSVDIKFATEIQGAQLEKQGNNLVLTFAPLASELIWDGTNGTAWDSGMNWHADGAAPGSSSFSTGNDVKFVSAYTNNVTQNGDVSAGTMTIDAGTSVTVNTSGHDLTVSGLVATSTSNLTKTGAGTATFGGDAETAVSLGTLSITGGTANFTGGPVTVNKFTTSGASDVTVTFDEKVTVTGDRVEINYNWNATSNSVTFAKGLEHTGAGTNGYALAIGNGDTVMLGGDSNFHDKALGIAGGQNSATGKLVLLENATLSLGRIFNTGTETQNGVIEIRKGAKMTVAGNENKSIITDVSNAGEMELHKETTIASGFTNTGTISVVGDSASSMGKLNVNNNDQSLDMGNISLDNAELHIGSAQESRVRNIGTLTVDGTAKLTQQSWNNFIHIDALNNGSGTGDRSFTWQMDTNHWSNSIIYLDGAGDFDGTFTASRGNAGSNGAYQGHVQINDQKALQNAVLDVNGFNGSNIMSVALNSATVETRGLQGNANAIIYAGEADATEGSSGSKRGQTKPTSSGTSTLALDVAEGGSYTYAGEVLGGIGVTKTGTGTQSFTGDLSAMNGAVTASAGTLTLNNSSATAGSLASATVNGGTLVLDNMNVAGAVTLSSGTLDLMRATNTGSLSMTGGTLVMDNQNWLTSTGTLAFTGGTLDLSGMTVEAGNDYILATGQNVSLGTMDFTLSDTALKDQYQLQVQGNNLVLTFAQPVPGRDLIWDGSTSNSWTTDSNWHVDGGAEGSAVFQNGDNVAFTTATPSVTTELGAAANAGTMEIDNGVAVTVNTNANNLTVHDLDVEGGSLTKTGTGKATFGGSDAGVSLSNLSILDGSTEFSEHVTVTGNRVNVAYATQGAKTGVSAEFKRGFDYEGSDSSGYAMVIGYENSVVLGSGSESDLGDNKSLAIARGATLELKDGATASVGRVYNSVTAANNGKLVLGDGATFNITNPNASSSLYQLENNGGTLNVKGNLTVFDAVSGDGDIVYNGTTGKTMQLNGGGTVGAVTVTGGAFNSTGTADISLTSLNVQGGTAHIGNSGDVNLGVVSLTGGNLVLNTDVTATSLTTTTSGATLTFAGAEMLTTTGDIDLGSGATFDLSNIKYSAAESGQEIVLAHSNSGTITLGGQYTFTNPQYEGTSFQLTTKDNNLVLVVNPDVTDWPTGSKVSYTYTNTETQVKETHYDSGTASHGYNFSEANGGVVEFNPGLFTDGNNHTYTDNTAREIALHADTTFIVEEGNTVHLDAQVIGNNITDTGHSGTLTKDGAGTLEIAINSGVFRGSSDYNRYEGSVVVEEGTLHVLAHSKVPGEGSYTSTLAASPDAFVAVDKDAKLILDTGTRISSPNGSEQSSHADSAQFTLSADVKQAEMTNMMFDHTGLRPNDPQDGGRANVKAGGMSIADVFGLYDAITVEAADILVSDLYITGQAVIDNSYIEADSVVMMNSSDHKGVRVQNNSTIKYTGDGGIALIHDTDVDKTSRIINTGNSPYDVSLLGHNAVEVGSTENGGVAQREIDSEALTINYVSDQYSGMMLGHVDPEEIDPDLSLSITLSDLDMPEDLSGYTFSLTFEDFDTHNVFGGSGQFVPLADTDLNVSLFIPAYSGGQWEELVASVQAMYDPTSGNTVFMFQNIVVPEPTTGTLSLLALAALAARRRRK